MRLRRSDFIDARYAFSFVLANFGIAIAARMPMITTTISSSISVKPLRLTTLPPVKEKGRFATTSPDRDWSPHKKRDASRATHRPPGGKRRGGVPCAPRQLHIAPPKNNAGRAPPPLAVYRRG